MNNSRRYVPPTGLFGSLTEFGDDVVTLAELQAKLAIIDLNESVQRATTPLIVTVASALVAIASLPILLFGLGLALADALAIKQGWALLIVGGVALLVAGIAAALAAIRFTKSFESFRRSREELARNVSWLRTVVLHSAG